MSNFNLNIKATSQLLSSQAVLTLTLKNSAFPTCYLIRLHQINGNRWVGFICDYSILAAQIRMMPELYFTSINDAGDEICGACTARMLGRPKEVLQSKVIKEDVIERLSQGQPFVNDNMILVEISIASWERMQKISPAHGIVLRT